MKPGWPHSRRPLGYEQADRRPSPSLTPMLASADDGMLSQASRHSRLVPRGLGHNHGHQDRTVVRVVV